MTYGLTGMTTLGTVTSEESSKDAQLFQQPLPTYNSSQAVLLDIFGASRTITISGVHVSGDGSKTTAQFIAELDGLISGSQTSRTYTSDKSATTYKVLVQTVSWKSEEGAPLKTEYTITMVEGNV